MQSLAMMLVSVLLASMAHATDAVQAEVNVNAWLLRMHEASRQRTYMGTFVVTAGTRMSSARIWHACDGTQQVERVESLSGTARSTFRRNGQVITFFPESRLAIEESRESLGLFPNLLKGNSTQIAEFYQLKPLGGERVAGLDADVVILTPKDGQRYGYKIWSERQSGLVLQVQTLDVGGKVLEQAAFSELQLDAPVSIPKLTQMMASTEGYRIERAEAQKTTPEAQGWMLQTLVPGFKPAACYRRPVGSAAAVGADGTMQWTFSDGLANVSLFVDTFDPRKHTREGGGDWGGATRVQMRRLDAWWITAVGEVPASTLNMFVQALSRKK